MSLMAIYSTFTTTPRRRYGVRVLQILMAIHVLYRLATELKFANYLWGPSGLGAPYGGPTLDYVFGSKGHFYGFLALHALAAVGLLAGVWTRASTLVLLATVRLLQMRLPELTDGGDNVMLLVTFFGLGFMGPREYGAPGSLRVWVHNLAVSAVVAQTVIIYATAGFYKFMGPVWQNGTALYVISQVDRFTVPMAARLLKNSYICTLGTYGTLAYQAMFPVAIFSRLKKVWLLIGISFHVGIILMMGLVPFSAIMIGLDTALLSDEEIRGLVRGWRGIVSVWSRWCGPGVPSGEFGNETHGRYPGGEPPRARRAAQSVSSSCSGRTFGSPRTHGERRRSRRSGARGRTRLGLRRRRSPRRTACERGSERRWAGDRLGRGASRWSARALDGTWARCRHVRPRRSVPRDGSTRPLHRFCSIRGDGLGRFASHADGGL